MSNVDRFILAVILGIILCTTFVIERRVALLNDTITLRDSTILRLERYNNYRDSIMWKHIEQTDSMHIGTHSFYAVPIPNGTLTFDV